MHSQQTIRTDLDMKLEKDHFRGKIKRSEEVKLVQFAMKPQRNRQGDQFKRWIRQLEQRNDKYLGEQAAQLCFKSEEMRNSTYL